ncbi:SH3 domain-containing protein [Virgibacillus halodenitrificans]|uniref:SH3 domain-containing protein n=1 Tax=Virgibacillus halodenitrificans TaxID=1482 RepID=UPI001F3BC182|nr:SH3 domain-containing protein [Virgibacillus halodenitrificans]
MKKFSKFHIVLAAFLLIFQIVAMPVSAMGQESKESSEILSATILSPNNNEELVSLYKEKDEASEILYQLEQEEEVAVEEQGDKFSFITYTEKRTGEQYKGYIISKNLNYDKKEDLESSQTENQTDQEKNEEETETSTEIDEESNKDITEDEQKDSTSSAHSTEEDVNKDKKIDTEEDVSEEADDQQDSEEEVDNKEENSEESGSETTEDSNTTSAKLTSTETKQETFYGIALKDSTNIYNNQSTGSEVIKSYKQGTILKFQSLSSQWYEATVSVNGSYTTGYINVNDVEKIAKAQTTMKGIAKDSPTKIYQRASTSSSVMKTYPVGSVLKFETLSTNWYEATVYVNGGYTTGYIFKGDVETLSDSKTTLHGIGKETPTLIYDRASTLSNVIKTYDKGSVLKYETFSENWYQATVYVNGKRKTGYIHKDHIENATSKPTKLNGVSLKEPTQVYKEASTSASSWKSYGKGSILWYETFSSDWYRATVYVNGKRKTGYIHKNHIENAVSDPVKLRGIALKRETHVFREASTNSSSWKSYSEGSVLWYETFSSNWYAATVYVNGKARTGYIHKSHVENAADEQKTLTGYALKKPTAVYSIASKQSSPIKSYDYGSKLKFKTFTKNWYEATVYVNGQARNGYIHADDITFKDIKVETNYNITMAEALGIQMTANPQTTNEYDTYVSKNYINSKFEVTASTLNVRGGPNTNYWVVGQLSKGTKVKVLKETNGWYQIEYTKNHQFVNASPDDILYYLNPDNFINDTKQQFQFLDLSKNSAATSEVLNRYLQGKGILAGKGQAFIDAGNMHGISDVYLISHSVLETGHGTSDLANGVVYKGVTVYNMFGVGAYDSCPLECGAKKAYDEGWTTPYKAIVGGAKFIGNSYIKNGLNTIYKMRWNPEAMANTGAYGKQYATDIGWAAKQVSTMYDLYQKLDSYILFLDVPSYKK